MEGVEVFMDVTSSHARNPAVGWDITASAKADKDEKIARAQIIVDDFPEYDKEFSPPVTNWQQQLHQQGQYPGDNTVRVVVTNDKGEDSESDDSWN
jgi:hypothetical protein